jgi:Tol biopolymer transport system component
VVSAVLLLCLTPRSLALAGTTERLSVSSAGEQGDGPSAAPAISAEGRFVVFSSSASNLVPGDTNGHIDVFVRDRDSGTTERVSVSSAGEQGNSISGMPAISADGRYVAFWSQAYNLVPGDTNGYPDVFVRDRVSGTTQRVSMSSAGEQGNYDSLWPSISADGRFVAFMSQASNLVPGDTGYYDVFVRDRVSGTTERVSVSSAGEQGNGPSSDPAISADGRFVVFSSSASNLVPGDTNGHIDVFVRDQVSGTTERASVSSAGEQASYYSRDPAISADGRYVAFWSQAYNLVPGDTDGYNDVFVRDRVSGTTERVSVSTAGEQASYDSWYPAISADGRFVIFSSLASNLVPADTGYDDVFVRDRVSGTTERVSVTSAGEQGDGPSSDPAISADGRFVVFSSWASNLVPGDTNANCDVFLRDRWETDPPTGDFSGSPESGEMSLLVCFHDLSSGSPTSWLWDFGDGGTADTPDPCHTYERPGCYTVSLTVCNASDCDTETKPCYVAVYRFPDVLPDHWAFAAIEACVVAGIVEGYPSGYYRPTWSVDRAQMAVYIARALAGGEEHVPSGPETPHFPDIPTDHWAYKYIEYVAENNIAEGYWNGYQPLRQVDRAQMAVFIARSIVQPTGEAGLVGYVPPTTPDFPDVDTDYWAYKHIEYCFEQGIVEGFPSGYYRPAWVVDRAQMAVYIQRAFQLPM